MVLEDRAKALMERFKDSPAKFVAYTALLEHNVEVARIALNGILDDPSMGEVYAGKALESLWEDSEQSEETP